MSFKTLLKIICIFMISIIAFIFCFHVKYKSYIVPGTVFSKTTEQYVYGKHYRKSSPLYSICVKPNDTNKFNYYSLYVDYATYCTHNVGNKIAFSVSEDECIKDFKRSEFMEAIVFCMLVMFAILTIVLFATIMFVISEPLINNIITAWF